MTPETSIRFASLLLGSILAAGCASKKVAVAPPPAPAPSAGPAQQAPQARPATAPQASPRQTSPTQVASSRTPSAETKARIQDLLNRIQDAYFDYNENKLRPDAETALRADAATLSQICTTIQTTN